MKNDYKNALLEMLSEHRGHVDLLIEEGPTGNDADSLGAHHSELRYHQLRANALEEAIRFIDSSEAILCPADKQPVESMRAGMSRDSEKMGELFDNLKSVCEGLQAETIRLEEVYTVSMAELGFVRD